MKLSKQHNFGLAHMQFFEKGKSDNWCEDNSTQAKCSQILIAFLNQEYKRVLSLPCEGLATAWSHDMFQEM